MFFQLYLLRIPSQHSTDIRHLLFEETGDSWHRILPGDTEVHVYKILERLISRAEDSQIFPTDMFASKPLFCKLQNLAMGEGIVGPTKGSSEEY